MNTATALHTATVSCLYGERGGLTTAQALCVDCDWVGPERDNAIAAFGDSLDHEDGVEVTE